MNKVTSFRLICRLSSLHCNQILTQKRALQLSIANMVDKTDTLLNSSDSWFHKYKNVEETPEGLLKGFKDRFNGITVDSSSESIGGTEDFETVLKGSLEHWTTLNRRGIWFKVHLKDAAWVPVLAKYDFAFHHAKDGYVMMCRWLPKNEPFNIPPYAHNMVGVGGLVVNSKNEILVVSEKNALVKNSWKLPGGYLEPGEDIVDAGIREVLEETSVQTKFETVIALRHAHSAGFGCSDLYIVIALSPVTDDIISCEREIARCEWMPISKYLEHPNVHETNRSFVRTYLDYKEKGIKIICREDVHQILKRRYLIFNAQKDD